jgi:Domain of unknown function (DUF4845)
MRSRQKGITFIGWLILMVPIAIVAYAGIRLAPLYLNYQKVATSINDIAKKHTSGEQFNPPAVRKELANSFDINSVTYPTIDAVEIVRDGDKWTIQTSYEDEVNLFAGISLVVKFAKRRTID